MTLTPYQITAILALATKVGEALAARNRPIGMPTMRALEGLGLVTREGEVTNGYNRRSGRAWSDYNPVVRLTDKGWSVAATLGADVRGAFTRHAEECDRLAALWSTDRPGTPAHPATVAEWTRAAADTRARLLRILP